MLASSPYLDRCQLIPLPHSYGEALRKVSRAYHSEHQRDPLCEPFTPAYTSRDSLAPAVLREREGRLRRASVYDPTSQIASRSHKAHHHLPDLRRQISELRRVVPGGRRGRHPVRWPMGHRRAAPRSSQPIHRLGSGSRAATGGECRRYRNGQRSAHPRSFVSLPRSVGGGPVKVGGPRR